MGNGCGDGERRARRQATAADRHDHRIERAVALVHQFERGGALAGDDARIGVGMHEHRAGVLLQLRARGLARGDRRRAVVQGGAVGLNRGELGFHRALGHDHVAGDAARARRQRERRAVVAGGVRDHAARGLVVGHRPHCVARAAELERARALQVLGLEGDGRADERVDRA